MAFKAKNSVSQGEVLQDVETLLRYYRKGIPLSEGQKDHLRKSGYPLSEIKTAQEMASDYVSNFKNISMTWNESVREGWDLDLYRYLHAVASVQAQMLTGETNIGWDMMAIFGETITDDQRRLFMSDQQRKASIGIIDVSIPSTRIQQWKKAAEYHKEHQNTPEKKKAILNKKIWNADLDEYLAKKMA